MVVLGYSQFQAHRTVWKFRQHDEYFLKLNHPNRADEPTLISNNLKAGRDLIALLQQEANISWTTNTDVGFEEEPSIK